MESWKLKVVFFVDYHNFINLRISLRERKKISTPVTLYVA